MVAYPAVLDLPHTLVEWDGTEIRVRRPAQGRKDRDKFISGKCLF
ncbi:MAG TPA: hypothetical protein VLG91_06755 [Streptomyces sp.]|nr:hypothetical protein [Streptomyces sp.]